jgi:hypothetical protein
LEFTIIFPFHFYIHPYFSYIQSEISHHCSTSTEPGLQGLALLSLLKSLFNDLSLVVIGDFDSSSKNLLAEGDNDGKFSVNCLVISITNIPSACADDDEEEDGQRKKKLLWDRCCVYKGDRWR